jgi:hypothetical protein
VPEGEASQWDPCVGAVGGAWAGVRAPPVSAIAGELPSCDGSREGRPEWAEQMAMGGFGPQGRIAFFFSPLISYFCFYFVFYFQTNSNMS